MNPAVPDNLVRMARPGEAPRRIYHVAFEGDWIDARSSGVYRHSTRGATLDEVGYIHASFAHQVTRIGALIYAYVTEPLVVLAIDTAMLSAPVKIEHMDGGPEAFPHIYGPLPASAVVDVLPARMHGTDFVVDGLPSVPG